MNVSARRITTPPNFDPRLVERHQKLANVCRVWLFLCVLGLATVGVNVLLNKHLWLFVLGGLGALVCGVGFVFSWKCDACGRFLGLNTQVHRCPHCGERFHKEKS
jgi:hypothetical protein